MRCNAYFMPRTGLVRGHGSQSHCMGSNIPYHNTKQCQCDMPPAGSTYRAPSELRLAVVRTPWMHAVECCASGHAAAPMQKQCPQPCSSLAHEATSSPSASGHSQPTVPRPLDLRSNMLSALAACAIATALSVCSLAMPPGAGATEAAVDASSSSSSRGELCNPDRLRSGFSLLLRGIESSEDINPSGAGHGGATAGNAEQGG